MGKPGKPQGSRFPRRDFHRKNNNSKPVFKKRYKPEKKPKPDESQKRAEIEAQRKQMMEEKIAQQKQAKLKRNQRQKAMTKKTKRGQPIMKDRIEYLLNKIKASQ